MIQTPEKPKACQLDQEVEGVIQEADAEDRGHYLVCIGGGAPQWLTAYEIRVTLSYLSRHDA